MTRPSTTPSLDSPKVMAAVMAAVQAYLEGEASTLRPGTTSGRSAWKAAAWEGSIDPALSRGRSWRGID